MMKFHHSSYRGSDEIRVNGICCQTYWLSISFGMIVMEKEEGAQFSKTPTLPILPLIPKMTFQNCIKLNQE